MGSSAPWPATVRRTLLRLVEGDEDVAATRRGGKGRPRTLSEVDDLYIGLLACCSKRKRKLNGTAAAVSRIYRPTVEVAALAKKRQEELHAKAQGMRGM